MIQAQTRLKVADNTGARTIQCIRVMGRSTKTTAGIGDVIVASVKTAIPNAAVKKGDVVQRRHRPHGQGVRPPRWQLHPLRRERRRADQQPGQPARNPDLRARRARAPRPQLHEDRLARPGGAVMALRRTRVPEIRKGDTVARPVRQGRRQAGRRRARAHQPRRAPARHRRAARQAASKVAHAASGSPPRRDRSRSSSRASTSPSATPSRARPRAAPTARRRSSRAASSTSPSRSTSRR